MSLIALIIGSLIGFYLAKNLLDLVLTVLYHYRYRNRYAELFDLLDDKIHYEMFKSEKEKPESYKEFLLLHQSAKDNAQELFNQVWSSMTKMLTRQYLIFGGAPLVLLLFEFEWYILGFILPHLAMLIYKRYYKDYGFGFYTITIMTHVLHGNSELKR